MASVDLAFQKVLFANISAALPAIACVTTPVPGRSLPYVQIGESEIGDFPVGHTLTAYVHCYSAAEGPDDVKTYQDAIRTTFHGGQFTQDGWTFNVVREAFCDVMRDVDSEHWHGVQHFNVIACS